MDLSYLIYGKTRHGFENFEMWQWRMKFLTTLSNMFTAKSRFYPKFFDTYKINTNLESKFYKWDLTKDE